MKARLLVVTVATSLTCAWGAPPTSPERVGSDRVVEAVREPAGSAPRETATGNQDQARTSYVRIATEDGGGPVLLVDYPWKKHTRPSIQIALATDDQVDPASLQPLALDGPSTLALWEKQVGCLNKPTYPSSRQIVKTSTAFIEYAPQKLLTLHGRENSLGKPSVYAVDEKTGTVLVFYLLESWADAGGTFRVALNDLGATAKFLQPGRIRVWFLDEEKVVWSETAAWPGKEPDKEAAAGPVSLPASTPVGPPAEKRGTSAMETPLTPPAEKPVGPPSEKAARDSGKPVLTVDAQKAVAAEEQGPLPKQRDLAQQASSPPREAAASDVGWREGKVETDLSRNQPPAKVDYQAMSIDQLAAYIEQTWGSSMSKEVRKAWTGGRMYYYKVPNPDSVRREIFMSLIRTCHEAQAPGELRIAFAVLLFKLRAKQQEAGPK